MFWPSTGERIDEVTTPICGRPTCTQSPWPTSTLPDDLQPDQLSRRMFLAADQRRAADEIVLLGLQRHGEADAGLERIGLVGKFRAGEDQPRLDAHHVERRHAHRLQAVRLAGFPHRVEHFFRVARVAENLVAELAGVAGARDDDGHALRVADAGDREAEPFEFADRRLQRRGPDDLLEDVAALRALHGDVVHLVGRGAHHDLQPELLGLLAKPRRRRTRRRRSSGNCRGRASSSVPSSIMPPCS